MTNYKIVEGFVVFDNGKSHKHTWMEYGNTKYDPCLEQFKVFGVDYNLESVKYMTSHKTSPVYYIKICEANPLPDEYIEKVLKNELKTSQYCVVKQKNIG